MFLLFWCASLWKTDVSLLPPWWYFDEILMKIGVYVFNVLVSEKLMFHCCFVDDFLMRSWWTMEISMQTLLINKDLIVLIFYFLRLHCCLIVYSLMSLWTNFDETLMILRQILLRNLLVNVLMSKTLGFHYCFFDDCFMILRARIVEIAKIPMQTFMIKSCSFC